MKLVTRTTLAAALLAAVALLACGEEETPPPEGPQFLAPTSPANVLRNLELSFNVTDADAFGNCFAPDFVFYFNPEDVGKPAINNPNYIIPESWNYAQMNGAVQDMLTEAFSINMTIPTAEVGTPAPDDTTWSTGNISITLTLMADEMMGYRIGAGYCNFEFERYVGDDSRYYWRLTAWYDLTREGRATAAAPGVTPTSLGKALTIFK